MAIDKSSAPPWVKGVIIFVAISFVVTMGGLASLSLTPSGGSGTQNGQASTNASDTLAAIASTYASRTVGIEAALKADAKNYDMLVAQGQTYQDWAGAILQSNAAESGAATPLLILSVSYYQRALAVKPGDPNVMTDMSIAQFYSGDAEAAIATGEAVVKSDPAFAPVRYNLGIYYAQVGETAKAIASIEKSLELDPNAGSAAQAKEMLAQLKGASTPTTTP